MAGYGLKPLLLQTQNALLREFFDDRGILADFKWTKDDSGVPIGETEVEGLVAAIEQLDNNDGRRVEQEFQDVRWLANEDTIFCMIEQGKKPRNSVDLVKEFEQNGMVGPYDRAMWACLRHNDLFKYTYRYQEVVCTKGARDFAVGCRQVCRVDETAREAFRKSIVRHYQGRGRGDKCVMDHCYSADKVKQHCFYMFQEDSVKTVLDFNEDGTDVVRKPQPRLFENIFFYEPETGMLRIHAMGEKNAEKLADLFCVHILGLDGRPNRDTQVYDLSRVKSPDFVFTYLASIEKVHVKEVVCDLGNSEEITLRVKGQVQTGLLLLDRMRQVIKDYGVAMSDVTVTKLKFQVVFRKEEGDRRKSRTKKISLPNSTELSEDRYDNIIRHHIENVWGFQRKLLDDDTQTDEAA